MHNREMKSRPHSRLKYKLVFLSFLLAAPDLKAEDPCGPAETVSGKLIPHAYYPPVHLKKESCGTIDLRSKFPPIRHQSNAQWCYAFSVADLLSFHLGKAISPVDIALRYQRSPEIRAAHLKSLKRRKKGCDIPDADSNQGGDEGAAIETMRSVGSLCLNEKIPIDETYITKIKELESFPPVLSVAQQETACTNLNALFPHSDLDKLQSIYFTMRTADRFVLEKLVKEVCAKGRLKMPPVTVGNRRFGRSLESKRETQKMLDQMLEAKQPVVFTAYPIFKDAYYDRPKMEDELHSMIFVGREWNEKRSSCEYLVRDSGGAACKKNQITGLNAEHHEKSNDTSGLGLSPILCENGYLRIPESVAVSAGFDITWIKK